MKMEWDPWIYEFKRLYRGDGGIPIPTYRMLLFLMEHWHKGVTPSEAVRMVKEITKEA
jgi:hypothetical protein